MARDETKGVWITQTREDGFVTGHTSDRWGGEHHVPASDLAAAEARIRELEQSEADAWANWRQFVELWSEWVLAEEAAQRADAFRRIGALRDMIADELVRKNEKRGR